MERWKQNNVSLHSRLASIPPQHRCDPKYRGTDMIKHTHTHRDRSAQSCTHLLVTEPVGMRHMPGRFCSSGRWYSTIKPSESLNQSPAEQMKNLLLLHVLHEHAAPALHVAFSLTCKLSVLPRSSQKSSLEGTKPPFSGHSPHKPCSFSSLRLFSLHNTPCDEPRPRQPSLPFSAFLLACLTTGLNAKLYCRQ